MTPFVKKGSNVGGGDDRTPIETWVGRSRGTSREGFIHQFPDPVLILRASAVSEVNAASVGFETQYLTSALVKTLVRKAEEITTGKPSTVRGVFRLAKSDRNPWQDRVIIGRTRNSDVVIAETGISKTHARCTIDGAKETKISDAGSRNGTRVNGALVPANAAVIVKPGDLVSLGPVDLSFQDAGSFFDLLQMYDQVAHGS